jgi:hypothetical protein
LAIDGFNYGQDNLIIQNAGEIVVLELEKAGASRKCREQLK